MTDASKKKHNPLLDLGPPDAKFTVSAANFANALVEVQRQHFEAELCHLTRPVHADETPLPASAVILAESPLFIGAGWSGLHSRTSTPYRWMGRLGSLVLRLDLSAGGKLSISGAGRRRKRYLGGLTVWIDDLEVKGEVSFKRLARAWSFEGTVPVVPARPYHILRLQTNGQASPRRNETSGSSLAISEIRIDGYSA